MKKAERLLDLITFLLNSRQPVTFEQIQNAFPDDYLEGDEEAIARKFERDKADILELGLPLKFINHDEFQTGGYLIDRQSYSLPNISLDPEELAVLYMAGTAVLGMDGCPFRQDLVLALNKLSFASGHSLDGERTGSRIFPAYRLEHPAAFRRKEYLQVLRQAIADRKTIMLFYHGLWNNENTKRDVDPYGIICSHGNWFLVGHCHLRKGIRVFHVDRITGLEVNRFKPKDPDFEFPKDFKLNDYLVKQPWAIKVHPPLETVLKLEPPIAESAVAEFGSSVINVKKQNSSLIVTLKVSFSDGLMPAILWYRDKAIVLSPIELREKTKSALLRMVGGNT
jgi:proteasome accessory factor B